MAPPVDAAYQGAPGAFSEDAALAMLGPGARLKPCALLTEVIESLCSGAAGHAVVPIENTLAGAVPGAADLIAANPVRVAGERVHPIAHAVIGVPGARVRAIRRVWSHPVALAQCERWFRRHPHIAAMPAFDTAGAVADVLQRGDPGEAAIAGRRAAQVYGGIVLADNVQDEPNNFTRFVMLKRGRRMPRPRPGIAMKTSLVCVLLNTPGSLVQALRPFEELGLNLTRIESRPIPNAPFEYRFHVDVGPVTDPARMAQALAVLRGRSRSVRVLGAYPASKGLYHGVPWRRRPPLRLHGSPCATW